MDASVKYMIMWRIIVIYLIFILFISCIPAKQEYEELDIARKNVETAWNNIWNRTVNGVDYSFIGTAFTLKDSVDIGDTVYIFGENNDIVALVWVAHYDSLFNIKRIKEFQSHQCQMTVK